MKSDDDDGFRKFIPSQMKYTRRNSNLIKLETVFLPLPGALADICLRNVAMVCLFTLSTE